MNQVWFSRLQYAEYGVLEPGRMVLSTPTYDPRHDGAVHTGDSLRCGQ
jgi:hypothetical protein